MVSMLAVWTAESLFMKKDTLPIVQDLVLPPPDRIEKTMPDAIHERDHAVDVSVARQMQTGNAILRLAVLRQRLRHDAGGQRQTTRQQVLLERRILGTQPRDLALQHRAVLGRRLAGPADALLAAQRDFAGLGVEPHETVNLFGKVITSAVSVRRGVVGESGRGRAQDSGDESDACDDHDHSLRQLRGGVDFRTSSAKVLRDFAVQNRAWKNSPRTALSVVISTL